MANGLNKLLGIVGSRIARNIYFWLLLIYTRTEFGYDTTQAIITACLLGLLSVLFYVNNIGLVPAYLSRKKYGSYFLFYSLLCLLVSAAYLGVLKYMLYQYPAYSIGQVSPLLMGGETRSLAFWSLLEEWFPYFIALYISGAIFAMAWYVNNYQRQQKITEEIKSRQLEAELTFLKKQINPHFLFNSLNNLQSLIIDKSENAAEVLSKISLILRYLLYESDTDMASFENEKEIMQAYIDLELLRIADTTNMRFSVSADKEYSIPPLLWLPILENVFKHGTGFISKTYDVNFRLSIEKNMFHLYSSNLYKPVQEDTSSQHQGIGLNNLNRRLKLIYNDRYSMKFTRESNLFTVDIKINL